MRMTNIALQDVEYMPEVSEMKNGVLYVSRRFELAIHLCACGCGAQTVTPIDKETGWDLQLMDYKPTLRPSIGNMSFPCKSHYFVTNGNVEWL